MKDPDRQVAVLIAARDARGTIPRAIGSALNQPQVAEVLLVDDASSDDTAAVAARADDGSGRLRILKLNENRGPAAARNLAIDESHSPFLAVLDADDFLLRGRFDMLLSGDTWDAVADNILFVSDSDAHSLVPASMIASEGEACALSFGQFVLANISKRGRPRGELGFVKPVIRRGFLEQHRLRYNETLRLGEDFELYARMLAHGARFNLLRDCGYVAVERQESLSANHRVEDLLALVRADDELLATGFAAEERSALCRHRNNVASRWHHRRFLAEKNRHGLPRTLLDWLGTPRMLYDAAVGITRDKLDVALASRRPQDRDTISAPRFLLPPENRVR